jgi:hypothetical protein
MVKNVFFLMVNYGISGFPSMGVPQKRTLDCVDFMENPI